MSDSDIFDFQISLEARDDAAVVLDRALAQALKMDEAIQRGEERSKRAAQQEQQQRSMLSEQDKQLSSREQDLRNITVAAEERALEIKKQIFREEMNLREAMFDYEQRKARDREYEEKKHGKIQEDNFKSLSHYFKSSKELIEEYGKSFDDTYLKIEANIHSFTSTTSSSMAEAEDRTDAYINSVLKLSVATGVSAESVSEFAKELANASVFLDDADIEPYSKSLLQLSKVYDISGEQVASLISNTRFLGIEIGATLDYAAKAAARFKTPQMLANLPEIINSVNDLFAEFGDRVVGDSKLITEGFISQAGAVSRAYNITIPDAMNKVRETTQKFISEFDKIDDVRLGLATDFGEGTQALFQLGFSLSEVQMLLKQGETDALGFATAVREAAADKPLLQQQRMLKLIGREFGGQTNELLNREIVYKSMVEAQQAAEANQRAGLVTFNDMMESSRNTGAKMIEVFNNLITVGQTIIGGIFGKSAKRIFGGAQGSLENVNAALISLNERLGDKDGFFQKSIVPVMESVSTALLGIGGAMTALVGSFAGMSAATFTMEKLTSVFGRFFAESADPKKTSKLLGFFKYFGKIGKSIANFGKQAFKTLGWPLIAIESIGTALYSMGATFADPKATGIEQFRALTVGLLDGIDALLLGIPSMIGGVLFPSLRANMSDGLESVFGSITKSFSKGIFAAVGDLTQATLGFFDSINKKLWALMENSQGFFSDIGSRIGAGIGGITKLLVVSAAVAIKETFFAIVDGIYDFGNTLVGWMQGEWRDTTMNSIVEIAGSALTTVGLAVTTAFAQIGDFVIGIGEGILNSFGSSFKLLWLKTKIGFMDGLYNPMGSMLDDFYVSVAKIGYKIKDAMISVFSGIQSVWSKVVVTMASTLADSFDTLANLVSMVSKAQGDNIRAMAQKAREFGGTSEEQIKEEERLAREKNLIWLQSIEKTAQEAADKRAAESAAESKERFAQYSTEEKALSDSLTKRAQLEKAQREKSKKEMQKEKSADTAAKDSEFLRTNKEWLLAVSQAQAAVDRARKDAEGNGISASNKAAEQEGLRQAQNLDLLRARLLGQDKGLEEKKTAAEATTQMVLSNSAASSTPSPEKPKPAPVVIVESSEETTMESLLALMNELLSAIKDMPKKEVSVLVDVSKDAIIREIKQIQQGQRARRGM